MSDVASLTAVSSALEDLTARITATAESMIGSDREDVATALYEVERSLTAAARRLGQVVGELG